MRNCVVVVMAVAIAAAACSDSNAPSARQQLMIYDIQAPASASPGDSIRISFEYARSSCDSAVAVDTRPTFDGVTFVVTSMPTNRACTLNSHLSIIAPAPVIYVVPPPYMLPFTARFDQPGTDSIRVIAAQ